MERPDDGVNGRKDYMRSYRSAYKARVRRVSLTLTKEEHARAERLAAGEGQPVSAFLKRCAFERIGKRADPPKELVDRLDGLISQVRGIANNVNQMARHSNRLKAGVEDAEVMLKLRRLEELLREFVSERAEGP